jgi:hypothetical protein
MMAALEERFRAAFACPARVRRRAEHESATAVMSHVRFQLTPNPNAGKFTVGRRLIEGRASRSYFTREQAAADPVATALFALNGVASVFIVDDFVTVTKDAAAEWSELAPRVTDALERVLW